MNAYELKKLILDESNSDDDVLLAIVKLKMEIGGGIAKKLSASIVVKAIKTHRPHLQTIIEVAYILAGVAKNKARSQDVIPISEQYY